MILGEPLSREKYGLSGGIWKFMEIPVKENKELFIYVWDSLRSSLRVSLSISLASFMYG